MLDLPLYKEVETEYQKVVASGKKKPAWYQLYGGPPNLEQLATRLNRQGMYEIFTALGLALFMDKKLSRAI